MNSRYSKRVDSSRFKLWSSQTPLLTHLDLELTERCNNDCMHCFINQPAQSMTAKGRELSLIEIEKILEEAASLGCLSIRLTGGEPLLREDFENIYLTARKLGLRVRIFTNGRLITPHLARLFARIPPLERIEITLYGLEPATYEAATRVSGSYCSAKRGIELLREYQIPFAIKGVLLPPNEGERREFEEWASAFPGMNREVSFSKFFDLRTRRDSEEKNRLIKSLRPNQEKSLAMITHHGTEVLRSELQRFCSKFSGPPGDKLFSCGSGLSTGCVDAYGCLQPCLLLRHPSVVYDLKSGSLREAFTSFLPAIREIRAENKDYLRRCARCFLKGLCEQCPGKSWSEHGTLDTPVEYFCSLTHLQARAAGLLAVGEQAWKIENWRERIEAFISGTQIQERTIQ